VKAAHRRRLVALLAAAAMLFQALWPHLSRAQPAGSDLLVAVCSIGGVTQHVPLGDGTPPAQHPSAAKSQHCLLCNGGNGQLAVFPPPLTDLRAASFPIAQPVRPAYSQPIHRPLFLLLLASPRAPPAIV